MTVRAMAEFEAGFPDDAEFERPEGYHLARVLEQDCRLAGLSDVSSDNWLDCGWCVSCVVQGWPVWVCFARYFPDEQWQLFVEHRGLTHLLARLLRKTSATADAVRTLAFLVEARLTKETTVSELRWSLAGRPCESGVQSVAALPWPKTPAA